MAGIRLSQYVAARGDLLQRLVGRLEGDERVVAAWLSGSFGRGEGDAWADFDIHIVIEDEMLPSFLAARRTLYDEIGDVALIQDEIPGQPEAGDTFHLVNFLSPYGPIEMDWSFIAASEAEKPVGHQLLFEKRPFPTVQVPNLTPMQRREEARTWAMFFWSMAPIAVRFCGRGETNRASSQIGLLSRALISLWRLLEEEHAKSPWVPEANRPLENSFDGRLPILSRVISPSRALDTIHALCAEAEGLQEDLSNLNAQVDPRIIDQTREMILTARAEVRAGRFHPRRFR